MLGSAVAKNKPNVIHVFYLIEILFVHRFTSLDGDDVVGGVVSVSVSSHLFLR